MAEEKPLEVGQRLEDLENMVTAATPDTVVLETQSLQLMFVAEHVSKFSHGIIVEVVVVKEDLL